MSQTLGVPYITRLYTLSEPSVNGVPLYVPGKMTDHPGKHEIGRYHCHSSNQRFP